MENILSEDSQPETVLSLLPTYLLQLYEVSTIERTHCLAFCNWFLVLINCYGPSEKKLIGFVEIQ